MYSQSYILLFLYLLTIVMCHIDFRERFLERKKQRQLKNRMMVFEKYILRDTETLDDIMHYRQVENSSSLKWEKIKSIEKDFRKLLAMDGMKYNYKRDLYWRTWRSVSGAGVNKLVSYKCNNPIQVNATSGCQNCGMWTIEERPPPCPYEFFSVIDDQKLCGANYTQYKDINNTCPSVIKFSDLTATCDNPIETMWRFNKLYGVPENNDKNIICGGKDFCEIFTSYEISPEHVIFRIINSTNDVMYSRIMKPNNTNYICTDDCGRFNPNTRKVAKTDKPLKLNLLSSRITKRDILIDKVEEPLSLSTVTNLPTTEINKNTLSKPKNGGNSLLKKQIWSKMIKRHQNSLDFYNNFIEEYKMPIESRTLLKTSSTSHSQQLEREADRVSYEEYV